LRRYHGELVHARDGPLGPVEVVQDGESRSLHFGNETCQSAMWLCHPALLALSYTRSMLAGLLFTPPPRRVLLVGLGAGSLAKFLLLHYPEIRVDALEPRPEVVEIAREYFALPADPRLRVFLRTGEDFVRDAGPDCTGYELALLDAYVGTGVAPVAADADFYHRVRRRLDPDGCLSVNLARPQRVLYAEALTALRRTFPRAVLRLPVYQKGNEVALALPRPPQADWARLVERAVELETALGLPFPRFLHTLRRDNAVLRAPRGQADPR
jgi:spermidine synthase